VSWSDYLAILRRRWWIVAVVVILDVLASGLLFYRSYHHAGWQGTVTLYVADVGATNTTLETTDQLLAGETAADFFADDIKDVAQSAAVASYVSSRLQRHGLPSSAPADISGSVGGVRTDRTVNLWITNRSATTALAAAQALGQAMSTARAKFIGARMARRTYVRVISPATVGPAPTSHDLVNFALRVVLGIVVAIGLALLWDVLDPTVRDRDDVETSLGKPVLVVSR